MLACGLAVLACGLACCCGCPQRGEHSAQVDAGAGFPPIGSPGSPLNILPEQMQTANRAQQFAGPSLFDNWDGTLITQEGNPRADLRPKEGILLHRYPNVTVGGHFKATGTFVCYVQSKNVYFLFGDCVMGHMDPPMGPYAGDPRKALVDAMKGSEPALPADTDKPRR